MSDNNKCCVEWCDLPKYTLCFGLDANTIEHYPALNVAMCALSKIVTNGHLMLNFSTHFIPFEEYTGEFPSDVSWQIIDKMKNTFTEKSLPSIVIQKDDSFPLPMPCAVYGAYCGRENEADENKIYLNKQVLDCSKYAQERNDVVKYATIILLTIIHELGHWSFHHFSCNMDHDFATPKGILMEEAGEAIEYLLFGFHIQHYGPEEPKYMIDEIVTKFNRAYRIIPVEYLNTLFEAHTYTGVTNRSSLKIPTTILMKAITLNEELAKFSFKRVFNPMDKPTLAATKSDSAPNSREKRVFEPHDKTY